MAQGYLGTNLNNAEPEKQEEGPPPVTEPLIKGTPHHLEDRLASLSPELKELFEKTIADKVNYERSFRQSDERARKTEMKLNEMLQKEQEAERHRLEEQGQYKELAAKAEAKVKELEEKFVYQTISSALDRELASAGAVDTELLTTALQSKYGDELKVDPSKAGELVARLKESKPLLFQSAAPVQQNSNPNMIISTKPTGQPGNAPQPGVQPSGFNALDKKIPIHEVEAQYRNALKGLKF